MIQRIITTVYSFHPCAGVWFLVCSKSLVPCSNSEFDNVKGDTILSICIAGEKSWVLATLCLIKLAFLCATPLTEHTLLYNMYQLHSGYVTHSLGMISLHTFLSTVTEKTFSQTVTKQKPGVLTLKKSKSFQCQFENARQMENETCHHVPAPFVFKKTFLCHCWTTRERKRRGNQLPGGNPVYISHLTDCKCYINISHWVDWTQASVESSTNYHSRKCTYTNAQKTHILYVLN